MTFIHDIYEFRKSFRHIEQLTFRCVHLKNAVEIFISDIPFHQIFPYLIREEVETLIYLEISGHDPPMFCPVTYTTELHAKFNCDRSKSMTPMR